VGDEKRDLTTIVGQDNFTIDFMANCVANRLETKSKHPTLPRSHGMFICKT